MEKPTVSFSLHNDAGVLMPDMLSVVNGWDMISDLSLCGVSEGPSSTCGF